MSYSIQSVAYCEPLQFATLIARRLLGRALSVTVTVVGGGLAGSEAALRVIVRSAESALPMAGAQIAVSLTKAPGLSRMVYEGLTGGDGTADVAFTVPDDLEGVAALVVETRTAAGEGRIERAIRIVIVGRARAAIPARPGEIGTTIAVDIADVEESAQRVVELGGSLGERHTWQRFEWRICFDPEGNEFDIARVGQEAA